MGARNDLDERALARAVFAEQGVHLTRLQGEIDPVQRRDGAETFGDVAHLKHDRHGGAIGRPWRSGPLFRVIHTSCQGSDADC